MSETNECDFSATLADFHAKQQVYQAMAQKLRTSNKAALFDVLHARGITQVVVSFDGYGDSGQIEDIEATAQDVITPLPDGIIKLSFASSYDPEPREEDLTVKSAIEAMAYDCLSETHGGWENNDGAYGEFVFEVADRSIALDYNERFTDSENYTHEF